MITSTSRKTQTAVCMILSAVIVSVGLSLGAFGCRTRRTSRRVLGDDHADSVSSSTPPAGVVFQDTPAGFAPPSLLRMKLKKSSRRFASTYCDLA